MTNVDWPVFFSELKASGRDFIGRYLPSPGSTWRQVTTTELKAARAAGVDFFFWFEDSRNHYRARDGGFAAGVADAQEALRALASLGVPPARPPSTTRWTIPPRMAARLTSISAASMSVGCPSLKSARMATTPQSIGCISADSRPTFASPTRGLNHKAGTLRPGCAERQQLLRWRRPCRQARCDDGRFRAVSSLRAVRPPPLLLRHLDHRNKHLLLRRLLRVHEQSRLLGHPRLRHQPGPHGQEEPEPGQSLGVGGRRHPGQRRPLPLRHRLQADGVLDRPARRSPRGQDHPSRYQERPLQRLHRQPGRRLHRGQPHHLHESRTVRHPPHLLRLLVDRV